MNPLFFFLGIPVGALLGLVAIKLEKRYRGKSDAVRGLLLGLPFAILAVTVALAGMFL